MSHRWSALNRDVHIKTAGTGEFDVVIIGGGITGAGIARECALRGLSFCLLDKNDFAFGTSSRSSKLFHGGIRYLSQREFSLVRESTTERNWLMHHFPNLVRPLGFMFCSYEKGRDNPLQVWLAVKLYDIFSDMFSQYKTYRRSRIFRPDFVEEFEPAVAREEDELGRMLMAGFYYDANCDDARVTLEIIKESLEYGEGSSVALNYVRAEDFLKNLAGRIKGVGARDVFTGDTFEIKGKAVVSATGIWTDEILENTKHTERKIYPTKGVHIVVPNERLGNRNAFGIRSFDDGRFFFVLRRGRVSIIGTTDTAYYPESKNLDEPWCTKNDCDYLLNSVNRMFPHAMLTYRDIIGTFAGIRPLIIQEGAGSESDVSRTHEIFTTKDGLTAIGGGKSTTHRRMAEDLLYYLVGKELLPSFRRSEFSRKGYSKVPFKAGLLRRHFDIRVNVKKLYETSWPEQLTYLHQQFGRQGIDILENIRRNPGSGEPLLNGYPHCGEEIRFILEHENAPRLMDVMCRRTEAQWQIWHHRQEEIAARVADIMGAYYGWSADRKGAEIRDYLNYIGNTVSFIG